MQIVKPEAAYLPGYVASLKRGYLPDMCAVRSQLRKSSRALNRSVPTPSPQASKIVRQKARW